MGSSGSEKKLALRETREYRGSVLVRVLREESSNYAGCKVVSICSSNVDVPAEVACNRQFGVSKQDITKPKAASTFLSHIFEANFQGHAYKRLSINVHCGLRAFSGTKSCFE